MPNICWYDLQNCSALRVKKSGSLLNLCWKRTIHLQADRQTGAYDTLRQLTPIAIEKALSHTVTGWLGRFILTRMGCHLPAFGAAHQPNKLFSSRVLVFTLQPLKGRASHCTQPHISTPALSPPSHSLV
jgi:hypothetical protein